MSNSNGFKKPHLESIDDLYDVPGFNADLIAKLKQKYDDTQIIDFMNLLIQKNIYQIPEEQKKLNQKRRLMDSKLTNDEQKVGMDITMKREALDRGAAAYRNGIDCRCTLDSEFMLWMFKITNGQFKPLSSKLSNAWHSGWIGENIERNKGKRKLVGLLGNGQLGSIDA
ncbi:MAG: hypothetical protein FWB85_06110 [Chitinispirillia bacterium]|nr:hypothetical protein [Chitinispirillia bacterium]MCL2241793.1 hypothetical protein [Chitinispirillia bacterium]